MCLCLCDLAFDFGLLHIRGFRFWSSCLDCYLFFWIIKYFCSVFESLGVLLLMFLVFGSCLISLLRVQSVFVSSSLLGSQSFLHVFCYSSQSHLSVMCLSLCLCVCYLLFHFNSLSFCVNCFQFYFLCLFGLLLLPGVFPPVALPVFLLYVYLSPWFSSIYFLRCPILPCVHLFSVTSMFPL